MKKAAAAVNKEFGLDPSVADNIMKAADEVKDFHFSLNLLHFVTTYNSLFLKKILHLCMRLVYLKSFSSIFANIILNEIHFLFLNLIANLKKIINFKKEY